MGLGSPDRPLGEAIQQARKGKASHPDKVVTGKKAVRLGREPLAKRVNYALWRH